MFNQIITSFNQIILNFFSPIFNYERIENTENKQTASSCTPPALEHEDYTYSMISEIDPTVKFHETVWTVTMVIDKQLPGIHARIVIEGYEEKIGRFFQIAHFQGVRFFKDMKNMGDCWLGFKKKGNILLSERKKPPLSLKGYKSKTDTWRCPREKVENMIHQIQSEQKMDMYFCILGNRSIFNHEVVILNTEHTELQKMQKEAPQLFKKIYSLHEKQNIEDRHFTKGDINLVPNRYFLSKLYYWLTQKKIKNIIKFFPYLNTWLKLVMSLYVASRLIDTPRILVEDKEINENAASISLMSKYVKKTTRAPDSCFTWARDKMKMLDIQMPERPLDRLVSISILYVNKPILHQKSRIEKFS